MRQRKVRIHVESLKASGRRFVDAWRRAERGEFVGDIVAEADRTCPLRASPTQSVDRALARELGRDYKRVHRDVRALEFAGLLEEDDTGLHAPFVGVDAQLSFS
jgi:hypothetical protein